jgi:hypothetical protein
MIMQIIMGLLLAFDFFFAFATFKYIWTLLFMSTIDHIFSNMTINTT